MTSKTSTNLPERGEGGQLLPGGPSLNPNGRPKGISITAMVKDKLKECPEGQDKKTYADLVVQAILKKALKDNDTKMLKTIWAYMDGQPEGTGLNVGEMTVNILSYGPTTQKLQP